MAIDRGKRKPLRKKSASVRRLFPTLAVAAVLALCAGRLAAQEENLETLDGLVRQWLELRSGIAEENRDWKAQKTHWEEEINLLKKEKEVLSTEIQSADEFMTKTEQEQAALLRKKESFEGELNQLKEIIARAEADLKKWEVRIPDGLRQSLESGFRVLPASTEAAEHLSVATRAQNVVALYTQIETLQQSFHSTHEMLEAENGSRRQVDVLYAGLARGFAVSPGDEWAAVGFPTKEGWVWNAQPEAATEIRHALNILDRKTTAEMVRLPMKIAEEKAP